jgi:hypothetical protein
MTSHTFHLGIKRGGIDERKKGKKGHEEGYVSEASSHQTQKTEGYDCITFWRIAVAVGLYKILGGEADKREEVISYPSSLPLCP